MKYKLKKLKKFKQYILNCTLKMLNPFEVSSPDGFFTLHAENTYYHTQYSQLFEQIVK